jgi:predicted RNase H-like HicB family nuclease
MKKLSFQDFVKEVLRGAEYKKGKDVDCIIAIARDLPGCVTQGSNYEEARENLIDAIELWITSALRDGQRIPSIRGNELMLVRTRSPRAQRKTVHA